MLSDLLVQTATIERWSTGEPGPDFTLNPERSTVDENVPCNLQERNGTLSLGDSGQNVGYSGVCYFEPSVDVRPDAADASLGDRIIVGGKTYQVLAVTDQAGHGAFLKVYVSSV